MRLLTAIVDTKANDLVSPMFLQRNENVAVRMFHDTLTMENSQLRRHAEDYDLVCFGYLDDDTLAITFEDENGQPAQRTILTGKQWLNIQAANQQQENL